MILASLLCLVLAGVATATPLSITATCDNQMKVYFDGVLQPPRPNANDWRNSDSFNLLASTMVVGIECLDQGVVPGILASLSDGTVTDSSWQCSNVLQDNWSSPQFSPGSLWNSADTHGTNQNPGYRGWSRVAGIDSNANWIWTSYSGSDRTVYCRKIVRAAFDCDENNPCYNGNRRFYSPHGDATKFVQCSQHGQCFVMPCGPGTLWDQVKLTCVLSDTPANPPSNGQQTTTTTTSAPVVRYDCADNSPCARSNTAVNGYYFAHVDQNKFVQCDQWGQCFVMPCGAGTKWSQGSRTCIHA